MARRARLGWILAAAALAPACAKTPRELMADLADPDPFERELAAAALVRVPDAIAPEALDVLLRSLDDPIPAVGHRARLSAAELARRCIPEWIDRSGEGEVNPETIAVLDEALGLRANDVVPRLVARLGAAGKPEFLRVQQLLSRCGSSAVDPLIEQLGAPTVLVRARAAAVLGELGDPRAVPALLARLADPEPFVRARAIESAIALDPRQGLGLPALRAALDDPAPEVLRATFPLVVRLEIAGIAIAPPEELERRRRRILELAPGSIDVILEDFGSGRPGAERRSMTALYALTAPPVDPPHAAPGEILPELAAPEPIARARAAFDLARHGPSAPEAVDELERALGDEHAVVRGAAALALGRIGAASRPTVPVLRLIEAGDVVMVVREMATRAIEAIEG